VSKRENISAVDTAWLRMDRPANLMMICGVLTFERRLSLARLRAVIGERFLVFRRFRQVAEQTATGARKLADLRRLLARRRFERETGGTNELLSDWMGQDAEKTIPVRFNGKAVDEGRSFAEVGTGQFDPAISLREDVTDPATVGIAFDVEGTPKQPFDLIRDGVTVGLLHNRRTAKALGVRSTGHAVEGGGAWGALGANLGLAAGTGSTEDLVAGVERGVLVTDFWYTRILDPRTQVVTGLTRNGVWLIEDGRVVRPLTNLRFTQSFLDALGPGNVRGVASERALLNSGWDSIYLVPALHLGSWNFTGGAKG